MRESAEEIAALQTLLDRSYAGAGRHLLGIHTPERRMPAARLVDELAGMCLLTLATVTADGRPLAGPVDGIFHRGRFHFGSGPDSVRARHVRARPSVSAVFAPGEDLAVTVHGRAVPVAWDDPWGAGFRETLLDVYLPRYGERWADEFLDAGPVSRRPVYYRIEPERMFAFAMAG